MGLLLPSPYQARAGTTPPIIYYAHEIFRALKPSAILSSAGNAITCVQIQDLQIRSIAWRSRNLLYSVVGRPLTCRRQPEGLPLQSFLHTEHCDIGWSNCREQSLSDTSDRQMAKERGIHAAKLEMHEDRKPDPETVLLTTKHSGSLV